MQLFQPAHFTPSSLHSQFEGLARPAVSHFFSSASVLF
jgi:hypothetical protein